MQRFTFDIWGDAVNVAARIGSVNARGSVELKNKGALKLYFLDRLKPEFSADLAGLRANAKLGELLNPKVLPAS